MWIGSSRNNTEEPLGLKWVISVKALGIVFTYKAWIRTIAKNVFDKLKDIRLQTRLWRCRGLSLFGNVTIIKSLLLPKMLYVFSILPASQDFIKQLNTIIHNFLWNGPDKITRSAVINDIRFGGLELIDLVTSTRSLRLAWLGRLFSRGSLPWKAYINNPLRDYGGTFLFKCKYDIKEHKINSTFYDELLHWWADFREDFSTKPSTFESVIWNNKVIKIDGKSIYYPNYIKAGIIFCNQMLFDQNNLESYTTVPNIKDWYIQIF